MAPSHKVGTRTVTIVVMSAATIQKKKSCWKTTRHLKTHVFRNDSVVFFFLPCVPSEGFVFLFRFSVRFFLVDCLLLIHLELSKFPITWTVLLLLFSVSEAERNHSTSGYAFPSAIRLIVVLSFC